MIRRTIEMFSSIDMFGKVFFLFVCAFFSYEIYMYTWSVFADRGLFLILLHFAGMCIHANIIRLFYEEYDKAVIEYEKEYNV